MSDRADCPRPPATAGQAPNRLPDRPAGGAPPRPGRRWAAAWVTAIIAVLALLVAGAPAYAATAAPAPAAPSATPPAPVKTASSQKVKPPKKVGVPQVGDVNPATWMNDLFANLQDQKLADIVFPGSHDTATYALLNDPISLVGKAQTEDITSQLNDGIRDLDLRVAYQPICVPAGWYVVHGILNPCTLSLSDMLSQIGQWTILPGHEHEIILVGLSIGDGPPVDPFPTDVCEALPSTISGLVYPSELQYTYGTTDPGQVTPAQLWAMPGHPRVIVNNSQCLTAISGEVEQWSPDPPFGSGPGQNYFADQCYANPYNGAKYANLPGITQMVLAAARLRSIQGGGDTDGHETNLGPPMVGGIWTLFVQATPNGTDCLKSLQDFDLAQQEPALAALYQQWQTDPATKANVNVIAGDFVQDSALVKDAIAMDESKFPLADSIVATGTLQVSAEQNSNFDDMFTAYVSYKGRPAAGVPVTYTISPFDSPQLSPHFLHSNGDTIVTTSNASGEVVVPAQHAVFAGDTVFAHYTLTASARGAAAPATWHLTVVAKPKKVITLQAWHTPGTVQAGSTVQSPSDFEVRAVDQAGAAVAGVKMTFDATGVGTFDTVNGSQPTFTQSTGPDGVAHTSAFTAGTRAGAWSVSVNSPGAVNTVSLPITITAGPPAVVTVASGDHQQTGKGQLFPEPLAVTVTDQWHNPVTGTPVTFKVMSGDAAFASANSVTVATDDHAVATAPVLTAGPAAGPIVVTASADRAAPTVKAAVFNLVAVKIAPTAPSISTLQNGDGQVTVGFSGAVDGTSPITSYEVRAVDKLHPTAAPATATGSSSPITVKGLTNGDPYVFTVTATSADGTSPPSAPTNPLNVGVVPKIQSGPANGIIGKPYSSGFTVTGAPPPTITLISGDLPPGLTLSSDGKLTGTPTQAGTYTFTVQADNHVGIDDATVPVTISPATPGSTPAPASGR
jgi:hypothetical protein